MGPRTLLWIEVCSERSIQNIKKIKMVVGVEPFSTSQKKPRTETALSPLPVVRCGHTSLLRDRSLPLEGLLLCSEASSLMAQGCS